MTRLPPERWQQHWHEMFDLDPPRENDAAWSLPLPAMSEDFRLLTGLAWTTPEVRQKCFAVLPKGQAMWERFEAYLSEKRVAIGPERAENLFYEQLALFAKLGVSIDTQKPLRFVGPSEHSVHDAFARADMLHYFCEDLVDDRLAGEPLASDAYYFLREPLYWQGNHYHGADWITWPLLERPGEPDLFRPTLSLWNGGWSVGINDDGPFCYDRRREFGLKE